MANNSFGVPDETTLIDLVVDYQVSAFIIECQDSGDQMCIAHFVRDGIRHFYKSGGYVRYAHLYFWVFAVKDSDADKSPMDIALEQYKNYIPAE